MKIAIPKVFQQQLHKPPVNTSDHALNSPMRVLSSIPKPLTERNIRLLQLLDPQPKQRYLNFQQAFHIDETVAIDYLGEMLAGGESKLVYDPLAEYSVAVRLATRTMDSLFNKFSDNLLAMPFDYSSTYKTILQQLNAREFETRCQRFDECIQELTQEMVGVHERLEQLYHTATILTDVKYAMLQSYIQTGQTFEAECSEGDAQFLFQYAYSNPYSLVPFEFDYLKLKQSSWPNNKYQQCALPRILGIHRIPQSRISKLNDAFVLLHEPYKQSLDDAIEFIFNLEQMINGQTTYRRMTRIKQREQSESFYLSLNVLFQGSINRYYSNSEQKITFLEQLFGKDIFIKQIQDNAQSGNEVNGVKLAKYSQFFVNFDQDYIEMRSSEHQTIRNKFKKINYTEFKFEFFNEQYLLDFETFYNEQLTYYNIENQDEFFFLPKLEASGVEDFLDIHYKNAKYSMKNTSFKQYVQQYEENSQVFTTAVLDVDALLKFNYHKSNFAIPEDVCNLQEVNKDVQQYCEQQVVRGSELGLLNQMSTDVFSRANYSSQILKRSTVFTGSSVFEVDTKPAKNQFLNSTDISRVEDSSSLSCEDECGSKYRFILLRTADLETAGFAQKIGTFRCGYVNFNHYFYVGINVCKFSNAREVLNRFAAFNDQLANVFKISLEEIMRKIIESTYWAAVSSSTGRIYERETAEFIAEVVKTIRHNTHIKDASEYDARHISHREFAEILISDEMFEQERRNSVRLLRTINLRIEDTIITLVKFICTNIIIPFVTQFVGIFYCEVFGACVFAALQARAAQQRCRNRVRVQVVGEATAYLDYLTGLIKLIFVPYKEIRLISSKILYGDGYDAAERFIVVQEAYDAEKQLGAVLDDVRDFVRCFETESPNIAASYKTFRAKYALDIDGISYQKMLERL